jgi:hypothetical protein
MTDDFGSAQTADPAADGKRESAGQALEKAAGVKITRPGGVDDTRNRRSRDLATGFYSPCHPPISSSLCRSLPSTPLRDA